MTDKIADKIAKLLTKAESTSPAEAEALTARAEELMIRHGVEQAMIDARLRGDTAPNLDGITERRLTFTGSYAYPLHDLGTYVGMAFDLRTLQTVIGRRTRRLLLVGYTVDVEQAATLIESLHVQAMTAMRAWWRTYPARHADWMTKHAKHKEREAFLNGFNDTVYARLRRTRNQVVTEHAGAELVLRNRAELVNEWVSDKYGDVGDARHGVRTEGSALARYAGAEAGDQADLNDTPEPAPQPSNPTRSAAGEQLGLRPKTDAERKTWALRESGYTGWIDQDGNPVPDDEGGR